MTLKEAEQERKKMKMEQNIVSHERLPDLPPRHEEFKSISIEDIIIQQVEKNGILKRYMIPLSTQHYILNLKPQLKSLLYTISHYVKSQSTQRKQMVWCFVIY